MSCRDEKNCDETRKRRRAVIMFGLMIVVFMVLSGFSFLNSRGQVTPDQISYAGHHADEGKRVFQAYNCMGCHTLVGNGAYFAPDLTKEYQETGPAWMAAFLPSAGGWPTEAALKLQLANEAVAADAGVSTIEEYYAKFPGAKQRVERRGGQSSYMPNLPFRPGEVDQLIAYLKYTSAMNTEGWPPKVLVKGDVGERLAKLHHSAGAVAPVAASATPAAGAETAAAPQTSAEHGEALVKDWGCLACHATDGKTLVGPGWGGVYGHEVKLADGSSVTADDAYLVRAIKDPNAQIVAGFQGVMPSYASQLSDDDVDAIVAYLKTLETR